MASTPRAALAPVAGSIHAPRHVHITTQCQAATWRHTPPLAAYRSRALGRTCTPGASRRAAVREGSARAAASGEVQAEAPAAEKEEQKAPAKPTMAKGTIVRVDKEKYLKSVEYLASGHPEYFKGLDYIYEARGEVLDVRIFESGEYGLISWAGIPTTPAWLPASMLIKCNKLEYVRT